MIFPKEKISIADGTPPHPIEPKYPGVFEQILSLYDCWDYTKLGDHAEEIVVCFEKCHHLHARANSYIYALGSLMTQLRSIIVPHTSITKVQSYGKRFMSKELPSSDRSNAQEEVRFLSGVTNMGYHTFVETLTTLAPKIYMIHDEWDVVSTALLGQIRDQALASNHHIISCYAPLFPDTQLEHIIFPELGVAIATSSALNQIDIPAYRNIHATRFTDTEAVKTQKHRIKFLQRMIAQMMEETSQILCDAKTQHDVLEQHYMQAMNYDLLNKKTQDMITTYFDKK